MLNFNTTPVQYPFNFEMANLKIKIKSQYRIYKKKKKKGLLQGYFKHRSDSISKSKEPDLTDCTFT